MDGSKLQKQPVVRRAKGQLREGLRYAWSDHMVRTPLLMMAVIGTLAFNFQVIIPLMATDVFGLDAGGFGALTAVMGLGAVLGALGAASRRGVSYKRLIGLSLAMGAAILGAAVAPTLPLEVVAIFLMGMTSFAFIATANTTMQLTSRPDMRGRVMALYGIAFLGSTPIGAPIVGWISAQWGPRLGFAVGGVVALLAAGAAWWSLTRMHAEREERLTVVSTQAAA
jgi:predicted MFS family arabinose efflux permease